MKCLVIFVATIIVCQIAASPSVRRRRGYLDRSSDYSGISSHDDPFIHPPWWRGPSKAIEPNPLKPNGPFGSYDSFEDSHGEFGDSSSEEEPEMSRSNGPERPPGYGGRIWWLPPGLGPTTTERNNPSNLSGNNKWEQTVLCIKSCPVTAEFNPVCGSNNVTYSNPGRLECEQRCGIAVELSKLSPCSGSEQPSQKPMTVEEQSECMRFCPVTGEYNPVCGSNKVTYANPGRLECAQYCGVAVTLNKQGSCGFSEPVTTTDNTLTVGAFIALCLRSCPVTSEFNPVCGDNNVTYANPGRLECAQNCGVAVKLLRRTSCEAPLTTEEIKNNANNDAEATTESNLIPTTNGSPAPTYVNGNGDNNSNVGNNEITNNNHSENNNSNIGNDGGIVTGGDSADLNSGNKGNDSENAGDNNLQGDNNGYDNNNSEQSNLDGDNEDKSETSTKGRPGYGGNNQQGGNGGNNGYYGSNNCKGVVNNRKPPSLKEVMACMQTCSLTSESNPVCGTDSITYMNPGRLLCAQFCGVDVRVKKFAPCASSGITNVHCLTTCTNPPVTDNPGFVTPPIPSIEACMEACPASLEFKPVCGTNNVTYRNLDKLQCARRCGIDVSMKRNAHCSAPEINPVPIDNASLFLECIEQCYVPQRYDPICGSNDVTYNNTDHLICARQCGLDVHVKQLKPCSNIPDVTPTPMTSETTEKVKPNQNGLNFTIDPAILANIWGTTSATPNNEDEDFELDQRVQEKQ